MSNKFQAQIDDEICELMKFCSHNAEARNRLYLISDLIQQAQKLHEEELKEQQAECGKAINEAIIRTKKLCNEELKEFAEEIKMNINVEQGEGEVCDNCIEKANQIVDKLLQKRLKQ